jgi:hypothetical protein
MECGLGDEARIVEKFKLTPTCLGIITFSIFSNSSNSVNDVTWIIVLNQSFEPCW